MTAYFLSFFIQKTCCTFDSFKSITKFEDAQLQNTCLLNKEVL